MRQEGLRVVGQTVRGWRQGAGVTHDHPPRPEQAEVEPHAGGARASVEREGHWTSGPASFVSATYETTKTSAFGFSPRNTPSSWTSSRSTTRPAEAV